MSKEPDKQYDFCKGINCGKQKKCKRYIGNYILPFIPKLIKQDDCKDYSLIDKDD